MNHAAGETQRRRWRFGLKAQLLLLLLVLNLVAAVAYSMVLYTVDRSEIMSGIDGRLRTAVLAANEIVPDAYHARIQGADSIPQEEFDALQARLSRFAARADLAYVYTYMQFGEEIRTVSTSATPRELSTGAQTRFYALYDTAPPKLRRSFRDGRIRFDEYSDAFGDFRSIYLPVRGADGRTYVVGADVELGMVQARLVQALRMSVGVGIAMFALSMALGWLLVDRIVSPLMRLTDFTRNMGQRNFQPDEREMAAMEAIGARRRDEVGSLAEAMTAMIARLQRYLVEMEAATAARERVEGELSAARDIQVGMLPRTFPPFPQRRDIDVYALLESAKQVGGDLYDYVLVDRDRLFFVVGDVSGKGVPAALFMAMTTTLFKATALSGQAPDEVMARVNAELARDNAAEMFVTAFCGVLDLRTGAVAYSDGGHEAPFVRRADGRVERLPKLKGMALGVIDEATFETGNFRLEAGDALVLFTDGVSEATNAEDALFTTARIEAALASARREPGARDLAEGLAEDVRVFVGATPQSDDIAILVVRYEGGEPAGSA
ncbi:PP2C family protein-serine/threonine phosphatase [Phenylobacterium kunshanense]|uniref:Stage II sporulation protein E n=1 Tax=Phenylobacterium kunshanense TaxID=1445034 RepID=A0A328B6M5_9CAUL|nr:SpoIIE family protein phosphatase [Phenylobacterium kunshanense]RAK63040.1 stage II sporulation protein E [Phenylobacterium kunshanense]